MEQIIYKTKPRLFVLSLTLLGSVFFGLLFWLTWTSITDKSDLLVWTILSFFFLGSLTCFYFFIAIRTVQLTNDGVIISYILLPLKQTYLFSDIKSITQKSKKVETLLEGTYSTNFKTTYLYTDLVTTFDFADKKQIKLNSIGQLDYQEFVDRFNKLKRREGKIKEQKQSVALYFVDNLDGLLWVVLLFIVTSVLTFGVLTRQGN